MNPDAIAARAPIAFLRRFTRKPLAVEQCELCRTPLASCHRHLVEVRNGRILCACDPCAWRFPTAIEGRFKLIPRTVRALPGFRLSDARWESFSLPINLAYFFSRSLDRKVRALYPSPGGATESLLALSAWEGLVADNPALT